MGLPHQLPLKVAKADPQIEALMDWLSICSPLPTNKTWGIKAFDVPLYSSSFTVDKRYYGI